MHVDVLIPTYDRLEPLKKCIKSIVDGDYKDVSIFIIVDGNRSLFNKLLSEPATIILNEKRMDYVFSMNRALREMGEVDAVLYASDELIFRSNCISNAVKAMKEYFPDTDGLITLKHREGEKWSEAFGLMGKKFIERFPDKAVFCPDYIHYGGDTELGEVARQLGRFHHCREAKVTHSRIYDNTYRLARTVKSHDTRIWRRRKGRQFYWGINFEEIGE